MPEQAPEHELMTSLSEQDMTVLREAVQHLEHPSFAARLSSVVGTPIEMAVELLPQGWHRRLHATAESAMTTALRFATAPMDNQPTARSRDGVFGLMGMASGAAGGMFGLPGLIVELPVSTTIMLRAIAEVARREGEDVHEPATRLACVQVFALGGRAHSDDAAETGYYSVRFALASSVSSAIEQLAHHGAGGSALAGFVRAVAARFGVKLSQKAAAQLVPVVGAATAATVNAIFIRHFQEMARSHFAVRRLERQYGSELVKAHYERLAAARA
jgi:hypothetical protein